MKLGRLPCSCALALNDLGLFIQNQTYSQKMKHGFPSKMFKTAERPKGFQPSSCKRVLDNGSVTGISLEPLRITPEKDRALGFIYLKKNSFSTCEYVAVVLHKFSGIAVRMESKNTQHNYKNNNNNNNNQTA